MRWAEGAIALFALVMVVAHGFAFILFSALCAVTALAYGRRWRRALRLVCLGPALALASFSAIVERSQSIPSGSVAWPGNEPIVHFQGIIDKLSLLLTPTLMTRWGLDAAISVGLWILMAHSLCSRPTELPRPLELSPPSEQSRRSEPGPITSAAGSTVFAHPKERPSEPLVAAFSGHTKALSGAVVFLLLLFLLLPHSIRWFGFIDGRLVPLILMLGMLAIPTASRSPRAAQRFERMIPFGATAMVVLVIAASLQFQSEAAGYRDVLARIPTESRLLNLPLMPNSRVFTAHPFVHYDKLILIERPMLLSDVWFHQGSALYPTAENPARFLPSSYSESNLIFIDWPGYQLDQWDFVLLRTGIDEPSPNVPASLRLVRHLGGWWLYRVGILSGVRGQPDRRGLVSVGPAAE
jgi:hypothetical protein